LSADRRKDFFVDVGLSATYPQSQVLSVAPVHLQHISFASLTSR
jgi:hypothetical protein